MRLPFVAAAGQTGFAPRRNVFGLVADRRADLQVLRSLTEKPPPPHGRHGQAGDARHVEFIEKALQPFLCYAFAFAGL